MDTLATEKEPLGYGGDLSEGGQSICGPTAYPIGPETPQAKRNRPSPNAGNGRRRIVLLEQYGK